MEILADVRLAGQLRATGCRAELALMNFERKIASLFILAAACGDNESMTTVRRQSTSAPSTNNPVALNDPPTSGTEDGTDTTAGSTDATSSPPTTGLRPSRAAPCS